MDLRAERVNRNPGGPRKANSRAGQRPETSALPEIARPGMRVSAERLFFHA